MDALGGNIQFETLLKDEVGVLQGSGEQALQAEDTECAKVLRLE